MIDILVNLSEATKEALLKLEILQYQINLVIDIIEQWHGIQINRPRVFEEMKNRIAEERRRELIKPVEENK